MEWDVSPTETATGGPNSSSSQFLWMQTPCWHREESFHRLGGGNVTLLAWVSASSQNFESKQLGTERKGQVGEAEVFSRLHSRVSSWALAGWSQAVVEATALPPSFTPQPEVSLSLFIPPGDAKSLVSGRT